jgi:hypothetical protein
MRALINRLPDEKQLKYSEMFDIIYSTCILSSKGAKAFAEILYRSVKPFGRHRLH